MNSATPVFLALLLVCSLPVVALVAADPGEADGEPIERGEREAAALQQTYPQTQTQAQPQTQTQSPTSVDNTTNRLELTGTVRNEHAEYNPGLAMQLARSNDELRVDADQYALVDSEFDNASIDEREAMLEEARTNLRERTAALEEREQAIVRAHANNDRSNAELFEVLLRNSHESAEIHDTANELHDRAETVPGYSIPNPEKRADEVGAELHQTPLRTNLEAVEQGLINPSEYQVQVRTAESGYSLLMIEDNSVLIETTRFDNRDTDAADQFQDPDRDRFDQVQKFYPLAAEEGRNNMVSQSYAPVQLYSVGYDFGNNHIEIFLDGGTGEVYREYQELRLSELPVSEQREWSDGGLEVTMNETPVDGPVEITVREASTGDPEAATVSIDGVEVGETDPDDGTLWYVPPTDEYELSIETSTRSVSTTITDE